MTKNKIRTEKYIKINEDKFYTVSIGEGEPIVFLHGGPGSEHRFFLPHVLPLANEFKLVFYDQRGCGKSHSFSDNYSMEDEVNMLESIHKRLGYEKISLFGESWGSMLALLYATTYPNRVNRILLTAAIGVTKEGFETFGVELEKKLSLDDKRKLLEFEEKLKVNEASLDDIFTILDPYYVFSSETLSRKDKTTFNQQSNEIIGKDITNNYDLTKKVDRLSQIPIQVAQGSHDMITPALVKELLIKKIPHARLVEIDQCGHWTVVECPEKMNEIAYNFFMG
ncbi:alpha/beta hydrolase [Bacillus carboniphilus]|uniref:Alpha/beta hydrolase n=1 Tax=Bacillus carboniphilus TaxID=86663 RepID=A0ABY9JS93_9BACI|nr:alpha/beta hydrolase [Bacillus carboniphilus]WLR42277.1 alpha/beta hydrolase [Bacillus carboniphilus]